MITLVSIALLVGGGALFTILYAVSVQPAAMALRFGPEAYGLCGRIRAWAMLFEFVAMAGYIVFPFGGILVFPFAPNPAWLVRILGGVVILITGGIMAVGLIDAGREAAVPSKDTKLYGGIYRFMRHPQTLGEMLAWLGIAMAVNSLTLFVVSLIWIPVFIGFTVIEDNDLALRFGEPYLAYTREVGIFWRTGKK